MNLRDPLPEVYESAPGELRRLLHKILDELAALRADLARQRRFAPISTDPALVALLREVHSFVGTDCTFSASELLLEADDELRAALGGLDARHLALALRKAEGVEVDGVRLTRRARDRTSGVVWSIERTASLT